MAPIDRAEVLRLIAEAHENLGIYYGDPEHLEITRENFKLLNELRLARNQRQSAMKRTMSEFISSAAGKVMLVVLIALATWLAPVFPIITKSIERVFQ
jgi:hypothetical protein